MAALTIPQEAEVFLGRFPMKCAKVTLSATAGDVISTAQETVALLNVPANCLVLDVLAYTRTAWTASVTITVGDGTDADGFLTSAKIAPQTGQTDGITKSAQVATAGAFAGGRLYTAADTIDAVIGGADPAAGATDFYIFYIEDVSQL